MKHTLEINEMTESGHVTQCSNLLKRMINGRPVLSPAPGLISLGQGYATPLATHHDASGRAHNLFAFSDADHETAWMIDSGSGQRTITSTSAPLICALPTSKGFIAMTESGPLRIVFEQGQWREIDDSPLSAAGIILEATDCGMLSVSTDTLTLKDVALSRSTPTIGRSGLTQLSSALSQAYTELTAIAAGGGLWMQPIVARYHLCDSSGQHLYSSMPMIMSPADGWQCVGDVTTACSVPSDGHLTVSPIRLQANTFKLSLKISTEISELLLKAGVASIEITATPQIHPFDAAARAAYRIVRPTSPEPTLTIALPGATASFSPLKETRRSQIGHLAGSVSSAESVVATIALPPSASSTEISRTDLISLDAEQASVARIESNSPKEKATGQTDEFIGEISSPNRFTARATVADGDTVAWADITPIPAKSINICEMCRAFTDTPFSGTLTVISRDNTRRHIAIEGSRMPTAWAPLVSFPDRNVVRLIIDLLSETGQRLNGSITLQSDGIRATAINLNLNPTLFTPATAPIPPADAVTLPGARHPGCIVGCRSTAPLTPLMAVECCHAPIHSLLPAVRSQSSWDFSRCHIYALSSYATYAVNINPTRASASASMIDPRGIDRPTAAVHTPAGVMAIHRGQLLKISASHADTIATGLDATDLAWDPASERLWMRDQMGNLTMRSAKTLSTVEIPSPADFRQIASLDGRVWLSDTDELYRLETPDETTASTTLRPIAWQSAITLSTASRAEAIEIHLSASRFEGSVELLSLTAPSAEPRRITRLQINGPVIGPIFFRIASPLRKFSAIAIKGAATTDFQLHSIIIHHSRK